MAVRARPGWMEGNFCIANPEFMQSERTDGPILQHIYSAQIFVHREGKAAHRLPLASTVVCSMLVLAATPLLMEEST